MGPDKARGPNKIWVPGIDLRTPWKIFSLEALLVAYNSPQSFYTGTCVDSTN